MHHFYRLLDRFWRRYKSMRLDYFMKKNGIYVGYKPGMWAIGLDDVEILYKEMKRYEQQGSISYLELGSGFSTIVASSIASKLFTSKKILSLEASSDWIEHTRKELDKLAESRGEEAGVVFFKIDEDYKNIQSVLERLRQQKPFDIILVDSPPDTIMPDARLKVINHIFDLLGEKSTLILHDTNRTDEFFAYNKIKNRFYSSSTYDTEKGIAVMRYLKEYD